MFLPLGYNFLFDYQLVSNIEALPLILPGHELVQYGMQGSGASSSSPRGQPRSRDREEQYARREWVQGQQQQQQQQQQQSDYDVVHHLFNGWAIFC